MESDDHRVIGRRTGNRALLLSQDGGDPVNKAGILTALSRVIERTGERRKAVESREAALAIYRAIGDQISAIHELSSEWQFQKWRLAYRFNQSFQDNRQPGREASDLRNLINGLSVGLSPHTAFDLNFDLNVAMANLSVRSNGRENHGDSLAASAIGEVSFSAVC